MYCNGERDSTWKLELAVLLNPRVRRRTHFAVLEHEAIGQLLQNAQTTEGGDRACNAGMDGSATNAMHAPCAAPGGNIVASKRLS